MIAIKVIKDKANFIILGLLPVFLFLSGSLKAGHTALKTNESSFVFPAGYLAGKQVIHSPVALLSFQLFHPEKAEVEELEYDDDDDCNAGSNAFLLSGKPLLDKVSKPVTIKRSYVSLYLLFHAWKSHLY